MRSGHQSFLPGVLTVKPGFSDMSLLAVAFLCVSILAMNTREIEVLLARLSEALARA